MDLLIQWNRRYLFADLNEKTTQIFSTWTSWPNLQQTFVYSWPSLPCAVVLVHVHTIAEEIRFMRDLTRIFSGNFWTLLYFCNPNHLLFFLQIHNKKTLCVVTIAMIYFNLASLWKFQYFRRPIYNPVEHL